MTDTTYNGWTNQPTWCIKLWIDNEEPLHRMPATILGQVAFNVKQGNTYGKYAFGTHEEKVRWLFTDMLKAWAEETFLDPYTEGSNSTGPHTDILQWGWGQINWHEIAQSYMDDNEEVWQE